MTKVHILDKILCNQRQKCELFQMLMTSSLIQDKEFFCVMFISSLLSNKVAYFCQGKAKNHKNARFRNEIPHCALGWVIIQSHCKLFFENLITIVQTNQRLFTLHNHMSQNLSKQKKGQKNGFLMVKYMAILETVKRSLVIKTVDCLLCRKIPNRATFI